MLDDSGPRVFTLPRLTTVSNTPFSLRWFGSIKRVIDEVDPDVVNGHLPVPYMADVAARVSGDRPFVLTYHNDAVGINATTKLLVRAYYRFLGEGHYSPRSLDHNDLAPLRRAFSVSPRLPQQNVRRASGCGRRDI